MTWRRLAPHGAGVLLALAAGCAPAPGVPRVRPEYFAHSIAAIGVPGTRRAFQIGAGSVVATGDVAVTWRLEGAGVVRTSPVYFEADATPIAHWWMVTDRDSVEFEAAAAPVPALGDTTSLLSVSVRAIRLTDDPSPSSLVARITRQPAGPGFTPWDAARGGAAPAWIDSNAMDHDLVMALVPGGATLTLEPDSGAGEPARVARWRLPANHGATATWQFRIPAYGLDARLASRLPATSHAGLATAARATWRRWLARAAPLALPDARVRDAYRAALVTMLLSQERHDGHWVPIGNPFQYRDVWLRDGVRVVRALAVAGLSDVATDDMRSLLPFQLPNGAFLSQMGQLDGTGQAVWGMEQAASQPPSRALARKLLPAALAAVRWLGRERERTRVPGAPWGGLMGYADPRDSELAQAQHTGNDAWSIAGCRAAARLATLAQDPAAAGEAAAAARDYGAAVAAALERTSSPDIPPTWQGIGRDWGNVAFAYPTGAMPAAAPRFAALAGRMWRRRGPALVSWGPADSLHSYLGTDLAEWALLAGHGRWARDYLADLLRHSSSTLGQSELFSDSTRDFGTNLPPHATAAAGVVDLVRNMIVEDDGDTLELAMGADAGWWHGLRFGPAPTRFGRVTLALDRDGARWRARWTPVAVPARVWVPEGARIAATRTLAARLPTARTVVVPARASGVEHESVESRP